MKVLPDLIAQKSFPDTILFLTYNKESYCETGRKGRFHERQTHISVDSYLKEPDKYIVWYNVEQLGLVAKKKIRYKLYWKKILIPYIKKEVHIIKYS